MLGCDGFLDDMVNEHLKSKTAQHGALEVDEDTVVRLVEFSTSQQQLQQFLAGLDPAAAQGCLREAIKRLSGNGAQVLLLMQQLREEDK